MLNLEETRVKFYDNRFNFLGLGGEVEKRYLNFGETFSERRVIGRNYHFGIKVSMSNSVRIQHRIVQDVFTMLGNVGGLYEFLALALSFIIGYISQKLF